MKYITLAFLICALVSSSNGFCTGKTPLPPGATHCQDLVDGTWHAVGASWVNSDCMRCSCNSCCSTYSIPKKFPEDCESVFDKLSCKYIVHKKNDPSTLCEITGAIGK